MGQSVKIRELTAPPEDLSAFDPGAYFSKLEFYETDDALSEDDRDGMAQLVHLLAFFALNANSPHWSASVVPPASTAFRALHSHFHHLLGWSDIASDTEGVYFKDLAALLMGHYPPRKRK